MHTLLNLASAVLLAGGPLLAAPTLFWVSAPVGPDETAVLMGEGLAPGPLSRRRG
jgi:hypothetical protein